jgi:hypothetical protein
MIHGQNNIKLYSLEAHIIRGLIEGPSLNKLNNFVNNKNSQRLLTIYVYSVSFYKVPCRNRKNY